jgi:hypothetical protein
VTPTIGPAGKADIPDHADETAAKNEGVEAAGPHRVELVEEGVAVGDVTDLTGMVPVAFQGPIGWGGQHEVNALRTERARMRSIAAFEGVVGGGPSDCRGDLAGEFRIPGNPGQIALEVGELEFGGAKAIEFQPAPRLFGGRRSGGLLGGAHRFPSSTVGDRGQKRTLGLLRWATRLEIA